MVSAPIRVRIAPSPTGNLHVGTARTALFNYLYAKKQQGQFILRIEDTDTERSEAAYIDNIFAGLKALGLNWDEGPDRGGDYGPYTQSERTAIYQEQVKRLLKSGHAYYSYVSEDELEALRAEAAAQKKPFIYREEPPSPERLAAWQADPNRKPSVRFRIPRDDRQITFQDAIRGEVSFDSNLIGDFVIQKSDGTPSYNFAVVVDDGLMKISHVIRGEDHISNTPKQLLLFEALGWQPPEFAHLSMILAPDRSKMSKRHGATAVADFIHEIGYLPEAFVNFIALLGWSPSSDKELFTLEELCEAFSLDRVAHSNAVFDREKLNWMNAQYLRDLSPEELLNRARPFIQRELSQPHSYTEAQLQRILQLVIEPVHTLNELPDAISYFFGEAAPEPGDELKETVLETEDGQNVLAYVLDQLETDEVRQAFQAESPEGIQALLKNWGQALKPLKMKTMMWTIRASVTGRVQGADLPSTLHLLGRERVKQRLAAKRKVSA